MNNTERTARYEERSNLDLRRRDNAAPANCNRVRPSTPTHRATCILINALAAIAVGTSTSSRRSIKNNF